jgi:trehalose-6-phosphatase
VAKEQAIEGKGYTEKAGQAKAPEILMEKPEWESALEALLKKGPGERKKALFLDFDGTMARFTDTPAETLAVHGFLSAVNKFLAKGYKVAVITGRPIEGENGVFEALKRSGATDELLNKLDIFGSHGVQHRGPETNWEVKVPEEIAKQIAPYAKLQEELLTYLQLRIEDSETLKGLLQYPPTDRENEENLMPLLTSPDVGISSSTMSNMSSIFALGISFEPKVLGATIHYRGVEESKHDEVKIELENLLSKILPKRSDKENFGLLENDTYKDFTYNSATESYEIRLNPATTGVEVNKGTSVKFLAERWKVKDAIAFGDDATDLDMQTKLQELIESGKLEAQAFVGVKHNRTPDKFMTDSLIVVEGQESAVGLLAQMAEEAKDQA